MDALIVGLGNPGKQYQRTRHNLGFLALDNALTAWGGQWKVDKRAKADLAKTAVSNLSLLLVKPQTYMNLSGEAVAPLARYYNVPPEKVLVVVDDINLPWGRMRFRAVGSAGGHNGLKSIEQHLGTAQYPRLRLGVGLQADAQPLVDHVLSPFSTTENDQLDRVLVQATRIMGLWMTEPAENWLSLANGWVL